VASTIKLREHTVEDFLSFDCGDRYVTMTIFHGKILPGAPGWAETVEMTPDQAGQVAAELLKRAGDVRSYVNQRGS
jgi:hypothetical protein